MGATRSSVSTIPLASSLGARHRAAIAIIDDDPDISQALGQWVELHGLCAVYFGCGECLLKALIKDLPHLRIVASDAQAPPFTLVAAIVDLNLPGMSGLTLAHQLRIYDANLPLVIVTAMRGEERGRYGSLPIGVPCLQKPFYLEALEGALGPVLHDPSHQTGVSARRP